MRIASFATSQCPALGIAHVLFNQERETFRKYFLVLADSTMEFDEEGMIEHFLLRADQSSSVDDEHCLEEAHFNKAGHDDCDVEGEPAAKQQKLGGTHKKHSLQDVLDKWQPLAIVAR